MDNPGTPKKEQKKKNRFTRLGRRPITIHVADSDLNQMNNNNQTEQSLSTIQNVDGDAEEDSQPSPSTARAKPTNVDAKNDEDRSSRRRERSNSQESKQSYSSMRSLKGKRRNEEVNDDNEDDEEDDDDFDQDHEGVGNGDDYTIKDRQEVLNSSHPFGVRLWKPALYKKDRSINRMIAAALHDTPKDSPELYCRPGNVLYLLLFGWWLSFVIFLISLPMFALFTPTAREYAAMLRGLSGYILWPFGRYVERITDPNLDAELLEEGDYNGGDEDGGEGREDDVEAPLIGSPSSPRRRGKKDGVSQRLRDLGFSGIVFYFFYYLIIAPLLLFVSGCCWFMVVSIPISKLAYALTFHVRKTPLLLRFKRGSALNAHSRSTVLLCTYKAIGRQYLKYTVDGTNVIFINLMGIVFFVLLDGYFLKEWWGEDTFVTNYISVFILCLASIIPLAYFIGQSVSSISAQSSLGMGAVINATFGSIVEVILYWFALREGKGILVEGSLIGSFLASLLLLPGLSMFAGGLKKKEQRFNAKSAGVTSTMLIFSLIGVCTPTLFYSAYGSFEMKCLPCPPASLGANMKPEDCKRCFYETINPLTDEFFHAKAKPLMYLCAAILPLAYLIGLWFTLRTHATHIYSDAPAPQSQSTTSSVAAQPRPDSLYKRLLPHSTQSSKGPSTPGYMTPSTVNALAERLGAPPLNLVHPDGTHSRASGSGTQSPRMIDHRLALPNGVMASIPHTPLSFSERSPEGGSASAAGASSGHDAPNWSKGKSAFVLCFCTLLFAAVAEILVDSVDPVVENLNIDEKFLGLTLFALAPAATEFINAISFAMNNNIALSMEIGSAYVVQVALLQIPALVAISGISQTATTDFYHMFTLIFPRWDVITVLFSVFLLTYVYIEGKANYFKGSMLVLAYVVLIISFFFAPPAFVREGGSSEGVR